MSNKKDIATREDIELMVNSFYEKVKKDELLAPIFAERIPGSWDKHLDIMYRFWETVLLSKATYQGSPFNKHADMEVNKQHFDAWVSLFHQNIDEHFSGDKAEEAKWRAKTMAQLFQHKLDSLRERGARPLI
jgi:hemoglobin